MEKERDFYFRKLREIELLCQEHGQENDDLVQRLMEVLYAAEDHVSPKPSFFFQIILPCSMSTTEIVYIGILKTRRFMYVMADSIISEIISLENVGSASSTIDSKSNANWDIKLIIFPRYILEYVQCELK